MKICYKDYVIEHIPEIDERYWSGYNVYKDGLFIGSFQEEKEAITAIEKLISEKTGN